jgi:hypothetical protein
VDSRASILSSPEMPPELLEAMKPQGWAVGCSDFHFFHISGDISPSLFSFGPKGSENVKKN